MHVSGFTTGGAVAHKLSVAPSVMRFSAWYDAQGNLTDCEGFDVLGRARSVKQGGPTWDALDARGGAVIAQAARDMPAARAFLGLES